MTDRTKVHTAIKLIGVEPIRREEHGEEEEDIGVAYERISETKKLRLPAWVFHEYHSGSVLAQNVFGIYQCEGQSCSDDSEDNKSYVCSIRDRFIGCCVYVLAQRD